MADEEVSSPLVLISQHGAIRTLTLNQPKALNSFTEAMHAELAAALDAAAGDSSVRCVVITGAGRGFCAGQDLSDPSVAMRQAHSAATADIGDNGDTGDSGDSGDSGDIGDAVERLYKPLALRIRAMPVPVIAAVNGVAAGAGANFALGCDMVIAARSASFIQAFSKIGLVPDCGGTWLLPRMVGRAQALGLAMTGEKLPAERAEQLGLIWKCVDDAAFADEVSSLAARLAAMPIKALVATREAIDAGMSSSYAEALSHEGCWQRTLGAAPDCLEGVAAFMAKRAPVFNER